MSNLVRYRFCTRAVEDFRPLVDMKPIGMPWWCTGWGHKHVTIVCYLPENEPLEKYWDDAFDIYKEHVDEIVYTDRFPKPEWLERSEEPRNNDVDKAFEVLQQIAQIEALKTANVVEVVRCKDCKHKPYKDEDGDVWAPSWDDEICPCICEDSYYNWMPEDDFFCKRGEKREDDNDQ